MVKALKQYDNVIFEILNEPNNADVAKAALWHWAVCQWIHEEDPDRVIAYNQFFDEITFAMYQLQGPMDHIGVFTVHASAEYDQWDSFAWLTEKSSGGCDPRPDLADFSCVDNGNFRIFDRGRGIDAISCATKHEPDDNVEKVVFIDSDGDMPETGETFSCDQDAAEVKEFAKRASLGGAGYINKTEVANFDTGNLRMDQQLPAGIKPINDALHEAFSEWYYNGDFYNSFLCPLPDSDGGWYPTPWPWQPGDPYCDNHNTFTVGIAKQPGETYKIIIRVYNWGTADWISDPGGQYFRVYDKCKQPSYSSDFLYAYGLRDWADIENNYCYADVEFTYTVPDRIGCNIIHEYYVVVGQGDDAFGDVLRVTYVFIPFL